MPATWLDALLNQRPAPTHCRLCGEPLNRPGKYAEQNGKIVMHWDCWMSLPDCIECGRGQPKTYCRECRK